MKSKSELLRIIEQRDLDLEKEGGLVRVILKMFLDAGSTGLAFFQIANRLFPELDPAEREAIGEMLEELYGKQLMYAPITPEHKAALAICDELIELLAKKTSPAIALEAALFALVITIVQFDKAKELAASMAARLPALVEQELEARANPTH
jgi:hypothetical protein